MNRHVNADAVKNLAPLESDVPTAEYQDTFGEVAFLEDRLAGVVLNLVEPVDGRFPGRTPRCDERFFASDSGPFVGAVEDLGGCVVGQLAVALVNVGLEVLNNADVVLLAEPFGEFVRAVECVGPVDGRPTGVSRTASKGFSDAAAPFSTTASKCLLGTQPTFTQVPPMGRPVFTIAVESSRRLASVIATKAATPPPRITRSYSAKSDTVNLLSGGWSTRYSIAYLLHTAT